MLQYSSDTCVLASHDLPATTESGYHTRCLLCPEGHRRPAYVSNADRTAVPENTALMKVHTLHRPLQYASSTSPGSAPSAGITVNYSVRRSEGNHCCCSRLQVPWRKEAGPHLALLPAIPTTTGIDCHQTPPEPIS
jgi:hypothetical protein